MLTARVLASALLAVGVLACGGQRPARSTPPRPAVPGPADAVAPDLVAPPDADVTPSADAGGSAEAAAAPEVVAVADAASEAPAAVDVPVEAPAAPAACRPRSIGAAVRGLATSSAGDRAVVAYLDGAITVFDRDLGAARPLAPSPAPIRGLALSPDGAHLAIFGEDGSFRMVAVAEDRLLWSLPADPTPIDHARFAADGLDVLVRRGGLVRLYRTAAGALVWSRGTLEAVGNRLAEPFFVEAENLVFVSSDAGVDFVRRNSGTVARRLTPGLELVSYLVPSPRGDLLAGPDGLKRALVVVRSSDLTVVRRIPEPLIGVSTFSSDGEVLLTLVESASPRGYAELPFRTADWTRLPLWSEAPAAAVPPSPTDLLRADEVGDLGKIDIRTGARTSGTVRGRGHALEVVDLAFSPDGRWLVSQGDPIGRASALLVWAAGGSEPAYAIRGVARGRHAFAISADSRRLYVVAEDGVLRAHDLATGGVERQVATGVGCVAVGADLDLILACGNDQRLRAYRDQSVRELGPFLPRAPSALAIAPDGTRAVVGGEDGTFVMVRLPDGQSLWEHHEVRARGPASVTFSPDGALVAATTQLGDRTLLLLDAQSGALLPNRLEYDTRGTAAVAPSGRIACVGTIDGAKILRLPDRVHVHTVTQPRLNAGNMGVAFSPVGDQLAMGLRWGRIDLVCDLATRFGAPP